MIKNLCMFVVSLVVLSSCTLGPDYSRPVQSLPDNFKEELVPGESIANLPWWEIFKDQTLQDLVRIALIENKDLQVALLRIDAARAMVKFTRADQFPRLDLSGGARRVDPSTNSVLGEGAPYNDFGLFGDLSFEIDIWGKFRRATEAERAALLSTQYAERAVVVSLVGAVASTYVELLGNDSRLEIAEKTLNSRKGSTRIIRQRFDKGIVPMLDVNQAEIEEADAAVQVTNFERQRDLAENALSVLLGRAPYKIPRGIVLEKQVAPGKIPAGYPASLLEKRPDILAAEEAVHAAVARIGVAEADRLPSLSLLGFVGLQSEDISNLLKRDAFTWSIGGDLLGPLIDFGKSASVVELSESEAQIALKFYEQSVLQASREVEDALVSVGTYAKEHEHRMKQVRSARNASKLSRARYDDGVTSYLEVLDVERSLFDAELGASQAYEGYLTSIVQLYKALGGGWDKI